MQEIINRILEGDFDYEGRALDFSCAKLELTLQVGTVCDCSCGTIYGRIYYVL